jgi:uncharacterized protein involved in cysteine biosynthesis
MFNVRFQQFRDDPRFGAMYSTLQRKPSWVMKFALIAAAVVVIVPIVAIAMAAVVVGTIVYFVLSAVAKVTGFFGNLFGGVAGAGLANEGRQNVRVIQRD